MPPPGFVQDPEHYQSPSQWRMIREVHLRAKSGRQSYSFPSWGENSSLPQLSPTASGKKKKRSKKKRAIGAAGDNGDEEEPLEKDFFSYLKKQRKKMKGEKPSSLVYGRIVDRPPADELFRKTLGLEQDKLKLCGRHPSKILPIPTLDKEGFHRIVDQHTEMDHIRENLKLMEIEEAREYRVRKHLREQAMLKKNAESEAKIKLMLVRIKNRVALMCLRAWNEHSSKNGKMRRFLRKTLYKWVTITLTAWRGWAKDTVILKQKSATVIQTAVRKYLCMVRYARLKIHTQAARVIQRLARFYLAMTLAKRMKARMAEEERKIKLSIKRIIARGAIKALHKWHEYSHLMALVRNMSGAQGKTRLRDLLKRWKKNAYELRYFKRMYATKIQCLARQFLAKGRVAHMKLEISSAKKIKDCWRCYLAKNLLRNMKRKRQRQMENVANMLRVGTLRLQKFCVSQLRAHADEKIRMRKLYRKAFQSYILAKFMLWHKHAKQWKADKVRAAITLQNFARSVFAKNELDLRRMESSIMSVKKALIAERDKDGDAEEEKADPFSPVLDEEGLPMIKRPSERLIALREEREEVLSDDSTLEYFDSKVLVFQQRFRMRANKQYLIRYIDSEIKLETKKVWAQELAELKAKYAKVEEMKRAEEERVREMNALFASENERGEAQENSGIDDRPYPTAGSKLHFAHASQEEMREAVLEWKLLCKDGWMQQKTMLTWVAKGLMNQNSVEGRIACWKVVRSLFEDDDLYEINRIYKLTETEK
jgi:hypothetical protein